MFFNGLKGTRIFVWSLTMLALCGTARGEEAAGKTNTPFEGPTAVNLKGEPLSVCSTDPLTGYFRDGRCTTDARDRGSHTVCATMTDAFLTYSKSRGNDLMTPSPRYRFPGLKPGDKWCLCAARWYEAYRADVAPTVHLDATHKAALRIVPKEAMEKHTTGLPSVK